MRRALYAVVALAGMLLPAAAAAQLANPPVITANMATKADVQQAADAAATAKAAADAAAATAAAACQPMAQTPPVEVPGGTTGSGQACRLVNSANNRISRTGQFSVSAGGAILCGGSTTCNWSTPLPTGAASYPIFFTAVGATGAPGVKCKVGSTSATGFTGAQCVQSVASISILGASVEVAAATGTQIFALSLPATQASQ